MHHNRYEDLPDTALSFGDAAVSQPVGALLDSNGDRVFGSTS
jgi:hypothetical protein